MTVKNNGFPSFANFVLPKSRPWSSVFCCRTQDDPFLVQHFKAKFQTKPKLNLQDQKSVKCTTSYTITFSSLFMNIFALFHQFTLSASSFTQFQLLEGSTRQVIFLVDAVLAHCHANVLRCASLAGVFGPNQNLATNFAFQRDASMPRLWVCCVRMSTNICFSFCSIFS